MNRTPVLGTMQTLPVLDTRAEEVLLGSESEPIPLPLEEAPEELGDRVRVFVYADRDGAWRATTRRPHATLGGFACMRCVAVTRAGAFMDWGLDKDLYIPPHAQAQRIIEGKDYVVSVQLDRKQERLIGTTHLASYFDYDVAHLREGNAVTILVYGHTEAGVQVVVDQRHRGLVHHDDTRGPMPIGTERTAYIRNIRGDNRLDIVLERRSKAGILDVQDVIHDALVAAGGSLPLHDRSTPAEIERRLGMSKKAFKRGVGGLYKARRIVLRDDGIALAEPEDAG